MCANQRHGCGECEFGQALSVLCKTTQNNELRTQEICPPTSLTRVGHDKCGQEPSWLGCIRRAGGRGAKLVSTKIAVEKIWQKVHRVIELYRKSRSVEYDCMSALCSAVRAR